VATSATSLPLDAEGMPVLVQWVNHETLACWEQAFHVEDLRQNNEYQLMFSATQ
jgi:hypothetical protein